jgi:hypothetical protein
MGAKTLLLCGMLLAAACRRGEAARVLDPQDAQVVALVVRSEPSGAAVKVNRLNRTWTTPCEIADYSLRRGLLDVEVRLDGHETVRRSIPYGGDVPAHLEVSLTPLRALAAAPRPAIPVPAVQEQESPPASRPAEIPAPVPAPEPAPAGKLPEGIRIRVRSSEVPVRITAGQALVMDGTRPGEVLLPDPLSEKILVEFLDPGSGAPLGVVEVLPGSPRPPAPQVPPVVPPSDEATRVGEVQLVHRVYGVFVKLDPGLAVAPGEEIVITRQGREVVRTKILRVVGQDGTYPDGALMLPRSAAVRKGDEVLRETKP